MKRIFWVLAFAFCLSSVHAQQVHPSSSTDIFHKIKQLNTLGTVMYVAAHPDDENTRLLSYLVHHDHMRTIYLSLTRGDGGQNIIGNEIGSALGLIRTHELLEARKIDGAEQIFSSVIDFGFTKSAKETFQFWNKDKLIKEVVEAIQIYKPDVMICRFPITGEGGHGQHTASAIIAKEAFLYIDNYNKENEGHELWLPKRLLFNAFQFGNRSTIKSDQFKFPINQYDPLLGEGYGEMAGRSRSIHRSQGAGTPQTVGKVLEHFELMEGEEMQHSIYDGIETTWSRVGEGNIELEILTVLNNFNFENPSASIPELLKLRKKIKKLQDDFWKTRKLKEIDEIILSASGIMAEALTESHEVAAGTEIETTLNLISRSDIPLTLESIQTPFQQFKEEKNILFTADSLYKFNYSVKISENTAITEPYWMKREPQEHFFQYTEKEKQYRKPGFLVHFKIEDEHFEAPVPLSYKILNPTLGDVINNINIVPSVSIEPLENLFIYEKDKEKAVRIRLKVFENIQDGNLKVYAQNQEIYNLTISDLEKGLDTLVQLNIPTVKMTEGNEKNELQFSFSTRNQEINKTRHLIQYDHIPELQYFSNATMKVIRKDWIVNVNKIGYIEGVGDYVDDVLRQLGLHVDFISENQLNNLQNLKSYETIIVGIRAFNTQKHLNSAMAVLMEYVKQGGNLIIQYNTNHELKTNHLGPYPLTLSRDRVVEEDAPVKIINPESELLNFPNKITPKDFDNWVQERGLYFPGTWDPNYQTLFSMHDQDEEPLESSVLYTNFGKGKYIHTSLSFFRQLPAGNKGAIRLFMNFLSRSNSK